MRPPIYQKRTFLSSALTRSHSFIHAYVESTYNGEEKWGGNFVIIADCNRRVEFEFCLGIRTHRRRSLAKINLIIKVLTAFRDALNREVHLIEKRR